MLHLLESLESRTLMSTAPVSATVAADLVKLTADRAQFHTDVAAGHATLVIDHELISDARKADLTALVDDRKALAKDHGNATALAADMLKLTSDAAKYVSDMTSLHDKLAADFLHWKTNVHNDVLTVHADVLKLAGDRQAA